MVDTKTNELNKSIFQNIPVLIIIVGVLVLFNLIGTCSTKSSITMNTKVAQGKLDSIINNQNELLINISNNKIQERKFFEIEIEKQLLQFLMYENDIDHKKLHISELQLRLENLQSKKEKLNK